MGKRGLVFLSALVLVVALLGAGGIQLWRLKNAYARAQEGVERALKIVGRPSLALESPARFQEAQGALDTAQAGLLALKGELRWLAPVSPLLARLPGVGPDLKAAPPFLDLGLALTEAGKQALAGVEPALHLAWEGSGEEDFYLRMEEALKASSERFQAASRELEEAEKARGRLREAPLSPRLEGYLGLVEQNLPRLRSLVYAGREAPAFLSSLRQVKEDLKAWEVALGNLSSWDAQALSQLSSQLASTQSHVANLKERFLGLEAALPWLQGLPGLGPDLEAAPQLIDMALSLTQGVDLALKGIQPAIEVLSRETSSEGFLREAKAALESGRADLERALAQLRQVEEIGSQLHSLKLSQELTSALAFLDRSLPGWQDLIDLGLEGPGLVDDLLRAEQALASLSGLSFDLSAVLGDQALEDSQKKLSQGERELAALQRRFSESLEELSLWRKLPGVGKDVAEVPRLLEVALPLIQAGQAALEGVDSLARLVQPGLFSQGFSKGAVEEVGRARASLERAAAALRAAAAQRALFGEGLSPRLSLALAPMDENLPSWRKALDMALQGLDLMEALLGFDAPKTYLLLGLDENELRPAGGFIGGAWLVTLDQGHLSRFLFQYSPEVDDKAKLGSYPPPPEDMFKYLWAGRWYFRDATWFADFPSSALIAQDFYKLGQGVSVDGVLAMTQEAIRHLVGAVGPLTVAGKEVTAENVLEWLYTGIAPPPEEDYLHPRAWFMKYLAQALLERIQGGLTNQEAAGLLQAWQRSLQEKNLLLYMNDERVQKLLEENNWAGRLLPTKGDYLLVADSNVYANKINFNIERRISYEVFLEEDSSRSRLTLTYKNRSTPDPLECLQPSPRIDGDARQGCYWNYLRVYVPGGSQITAPPLLPLPEGSLYYQAGRREENTFSAKHLEGDKLTLSGFFVVPPGGEGGVAFEYETPSPLVAEGGRLIYTLLVQKQPGTRGDRLQVVVHYPEEWGLALSSPAANSGRPGVVAFEGILDTDRAFTLAFQPWEGTP